MTKAEFDKIVNAGKSAGLDSYVVRAEGGNRMFYHNNDFGIIYPKDTYVVCFELSRNYANEKGQFNISLVPYDDIDTVKIIDIPFVEALNLMDKLGCKDDALLELVKKTPRRQPIQPGTAGLAPIKDKDGNDTINTPVAGYVTK